MQDLILGRVRKTYRTLLYTDAQVVPSPWNSEMYIHMHLDLQYALDKNNKKNNNKKVKKKKKKDANSSCEVVSANLWSSELL